MLQGGFPLILPCGFSLVFFLKGQNKGNFLLSSGYFIKKSCGCSLCSLGRVGIDVRGSIDDGVSQQFLHILRRGSVGQQIGSEGMSEQMEVKFSQLRHFFRAFRRILLTVV